MPSHFSSLPCCATRVPALAKQAALFLAVAFFHAFAQLSLRSHFKAVQFASMPLLCLALPSLCTAYHRYAFAFRDQAAPLPRCARVCSAIAEQGISFASRGFAPAVPVVAIALLGPTSLFPCLSERTVLRLCCALQCYALAVRGNSTLFLCLPRLCHCCVGARLRRGRADHRHTIAASPCALGRTRSFRT